MVKNTLKLAIILLIAFLWLPNGTGEDLLMIPIIINLVGFKAYILISILLVAYLYHTIEGRDLGAKMRNIRKEVKSLF